MPIRPLNDNVLIARIEAEDKSPGGIFIPNAAKDKPLEGIVVAVGPGRYLENGTRIPVEVKAGDRVLFAKFAENEFNLNGEKRIIVREQDIHCVFER